MKIIFVGFVDVMNLGDLIIVDTLEKELFRNHEVSKYNFKFKKVDTIPSYEEVDCTLKTRNRGSNLSEKLKTNFRSNLLIDYFLSKRNKKRIYASPYIEDFKKAIRVCDLVVIGGGNMIFDRTRFSESYYKVDSIIDIAKQYKKKVFVTSIGIGPFVTNKQIEYMKQTLQKADYVTVRDHKSYSYVIDLKNKVYLSVDPVFVMGENDDTFKVRNNKKVAAISVIDLRLNGCNSREYEEYINKMRMLINSLIEKDYKIILYSTDFLDYTAVDYLAKGLSADSKIEYIHNEDELLKIYSNCDLVIGTRMHSLIIAIAQNIPVIGLSWQPKVKNMFKMVDLEEYCYDLDLSAGDLSSRILNKLQKDPYLDEQRKQLKFIRNNNIEKFNINRIILSRLLDEKEGEISNL